MTVPRSSGTCKCRNPIGWFLHLLSFFIYSVSVAFTAPDLEPIWERDSLDWKDLAAPEIVKRVTTKVQPGSIVLFHNAALHTPEALPTIIETLLQEGYTFVPISEIILPQPYSIDHTGKQMPAAG